MTAPADESLQQLLVLAIDVVEEAARTADRRPEALEIGTKANRNDLVTQVDRAIEDAVARRLLDETGRRGTRTTPTPAGSGCSIPSTGP